MTNPESQQPGEPEPSANPAEAVESVLPFPTRPEVESGSPAPDQPLEDPLTQIVRHAQEVERLHARLDGIARSEVLPDCLMPPVFEPRKVFEDQTGSVWSDKLLWPRDRSTGSVVIATPDELLAWAKRVIREPNTDWDTLIAEETEREAKLLNTITRGFGRVPRRLLTLQQGQRIQAAAVSHVVADFSLHTVVDQGVVAPFTRPRRLQVELVALQKALDRLLLPTHQARLQAGRLSRPTTDQGLPLAIQTAAEVLKAVETTTVAWGAYELAKGSALKSRLSSILLTQPCSRLYGQVCWSVQESNGLEIVKTPRR